MAVTEAGAAGEERRRSRWFWWAGGGQPQLTSWQISPRSRSV